VPVLDYTPNGTGTLFVGEGDLEGFWRYFDRDRATGNEYGGALTGYLTAHATQWGLVVVDEVHYWTADEYRGHVGHSSAPGLREVADPAPANHRRALELARNQPSVAVEPPRIPTLSGDLLDDVRTLTGLTYAELGAGFGISERAVAGWRREGIPRHRLPAFQALRSIGLSLIGGLGVLGVHDWLLRGSPTRLLQVLQGDVAAVAADARAYESSPAT
jgi:hypothetical protein